MPTTSTDFVSDVLGITANSSIAPIIGALVVIALFSRFAQGFKGFAR